jgi:hypothetical protein
MKQSTLYQLSAYSLIGGAICMAVFWLLAAWLGSFAGAAVTHDPLWVPAQVLHCLAALLTLFGLFGLYTAQYEKMGVLGLVGFVLATIGTTLFFADGLIALAIYPALAGTAPELLSASGAMNSGAVLVAFIVMAATAMIGYIVFAAAILRAGVLPRAAALLFLLGGILFNLPPGPVPMIVLAIGGILWAIGSIWLALKFPKVERGHARKEGLKSYQAG